MSWENIEGFSWDICPFYAFIEKQIPQGGRFVEVGVLYGRSLACMGTLRPDVQLHAVDVFTAAVETSMQPYVDRMGGGGHWEVFEKGLAMYAPAVRPIIHRGRSAEVQIGDCDFVFLDAGHDEASVRGDVANWRPQVKPGAILAGHDYEPNYPGLMKVVDEMFPSRQIQNSCWWVQL